MLLFLTLIDDPDEKRLFELLYTAYEQQMFYIAYSILKDSQLAEDAVHNAFLKLIDHLSRIEEPECNKTKSFLSILVRHASIDLYRKRKSKKELHTEEIFDIPVSDSTCETEPALQIIQILPISYQNIFTLKYVHEYSDKEIARILDLRPGNVRQRVHRGKRLLKEKLSMNGGDTHEPI